MWVGGETRQRRFSSACQTVTVGGGLRHFRDGRNAASTRTAPPELRHARRRELPGQVGERALAVVESNEMGEQSLFVLAR